MPGTVVSAFTVVLWWFSLSELRGFAQLAIILASYPVAFILTHALIAKYRVEDDSAITIDEVLGQLIALIAIPKSIGWVLLAFVGFRVLDILKPDPVGWAERRFKGAFGILADDIVAGLVVVAVLHFILMLSKSITG